MLKWLEKTPPSAVPQVEPKLRAFKQEIYKLYKIDHPVEIREKDSAIKKFKQTYEIKGIEGIETKITHLFQNI